MDGPLLLDMELSDTEDELPTANETAYEERAQKKAKKSPLREHYVAPLSFLVDAVQAAAQAKDNFNITKVGEPFGMVNEAYARQCYEDIVQAILRFSRKIANIANKRGPEPCYLSFVGLLELANLPFLLTL
jgi:hypothetical protein